MNDLIRKIVNEVRLQIFTEEEKGDKQIIAIYPGRFQPMGRHHKMAYEWLAKQFGEENTYIVTSDKVEPQKSPLTFDEKTKVIKKHGVKNITKANNPFFPTEFLKKFDPQKTVIVMMVDVEDKPELLGMNRLMKYNKTTVLPFKDLDNPYVYHMFAPRISLQLGDFGQLSGDTIRKALGDREAKLAQLKERFKMAMGWFDPAIFNMLIAKMNTRRGKIKEGILDWKSGILRMKKQEAKLFLGMIKKEYGDAKDMLPVIQKFLRKEKITSEEKAKFMKDTKRLMKLVGLGSIALIPIPGTMLLIPVIVKLARKYNVELMPQQMEESNQALPIVRREFWDEVFQEVAKEDGEKKKEKLDEVVYIPNDMLIDLEDVSMNLFERLADGVTEESTLTDIIEYFHSFLEEQDDTWEIQKMGQIINDWITNEPYCQEYLETAENLPFYFFGIGISASDSFPYLEEVFNLLSYCTNNNCDPLGDEVKAVLDDTYDSDYEERRNIDYAKFEENLKQFAAFDKFSYGAQLRTVDFNGIYGMKVLMNFSWVPFLTKVAFIKSGVFSDLGGINVRHSVSQMITKYVKEEFIPEVAHELTHLAQHARSLVSRRIVAPPTYHGMSSSDPDFWRVYLSDSSEIGAHAVQFAKELQRHFKDKNSKELLKMLQLGEFPKTQFAAMNSYYDTFKKEVLEKREDPSYRKFLKLVYQNLMQDEKDKYKKD